MAFFLALKQMAKIPMEILLKEETSTACLLAVPPLPTLVESSLGPQFPMASMMT
jgi:hypothetical protein